GRRRCDVRKNDVGLLCNQFLRESAHQFHVGGCHPTGVDVNVAALCPPEFLKLLSERLDMRLSFQVVLGIAHQHPDAPHPVGLLRARRERPRSRRAAECGQQFPPSDGDCHTPLPREGAFAKIPRHERAVLTARPSARVGGGTPGTGLGSPPTLRLAFKSCLLCPRKRTSLACLGMSALCQKRTHAVQQIYSITS